VKRIILGTILIFSASCGSRSSVNTSFDIRINEIVPDGSGSDWIELVNPGAKAVDLGGYYLSDNYDRLRKWRVPPSTVIEAGTNAFVVFDTGGDGSDPHKISFGLSESTGEEVFLVAPDGITVIDRVKFPPLGYNTAWARDPEDFDTWRPTASPTPGRENIIVDVAVLVREITPALPHSPFTVVVSAAGEVRPWGGGEPPALLFYRIGNRDWESVRMTPAAGGSTGGELFFSHTISGENLAGGTVVGLLAAVQNERGMWITTPYLADFDPRQGPSSTDYVFKVRVGNELTFMLSEIMPSNSLYHLDEEHPNRTADWIELFNYGARRICLSNVDLIVTVDQGRPDAPDLLLEFPPSGGTRCAETLTVWPGCGYLLFADGPRPDDQGRLEPAPHLPFRLSRRGESIRLVQKLSETNYIEIDRISYQGLEPDRTYGRPGSARKAPGTVLSSVSPRFANAFDGARIWFAGDVPAWVEWEGDSVNPPPDSPLTVRARVVWEGAWLGENSPEFELPEAILYWRVDGEPSGSVDEAEMDREKTPGSQGEPFPFSFTFKTQLGPFPEGSVVRWWVEAVSPEGESVWHGSRGSSDRPPSLSEAHAFTVTSVSSPLRITEVGVGSVYDVYEAEDGSGPVKRLRSFVEFHNAGSEPVTLSGKLFSIFPPLEGGPPGKSEGWKLTSEVLEKDVLEPGEYTAFWLDGAFADGRPSLLAAFRGAAAALYDPVEEGNLCLDRFSFPELSTWEGGGGFGRTETAPDGIPLPATPGAPNPSGPPRLHINELYVWEAEEKWIEIFNSGGATVALEGLQLGNAARNAPVSGEGISVEPGGFAVIRLAGGPAEGAWCQIDYDPDYDEVYLFAPASWPWGDPGELLDRVNYKEGVEPPDNPSSPFAKWPTPPAGRSLARIPDGGEEFAPSAPTPGRSNEPTGVTFIRGDCNEDGILDPTSDPDLNTDMAALAAYLEGTGPALRCEDRCDINDDGKINLSDRIAFLRWYFYGDPPHLPAPFPDPGEDSTPDSLRCE